MRRLLILLLILPVLILQVSAMEFSPPDAPDGALEYMPQDTESFGEGLLYVIQAGLNALYPSLTEGVKTCFSMLAAVILISFLRNFTSGIHHVVRLTGTLIISLLLIQPTNAMIQLGTRTVTELSEYGKLLMPVLTGALAAQGGGTSSAGLYAGTMLFNTILTTAISKLLIPLLYIFLCLSIASAAIGEGVLKEMQKFIKWLKTWCLKIILYAFTGYMSITKVVGGSADAAAIKAAKLVLSGTVPVVGGIISDASETILVSAGVMKNAAGVYGLLAILAVFVSPFLHIGAQYLLLKITAAVCSLFADKDTVSIVKDFSSAMGFLLAMTGSVCLILLVSAVCFMMGVS